jgi:hypothetical protein
MTVKKAVLYTNLLWLAVAGSCASLPTIHTYIIGSDGKQTDLVESNTGAILTFLQAQGYRCYSESDDTLWRNQYLIQEECCSSKN